MKVPAAGPNFPPENVTSLTAWLRWLEATRGQECTMNAKFDLSNLRRMAAVVLPAWLFSSRRPVRIITVGGTNGKGSTVAFLGSLLKVAGIRAGSWTSPHLQLFNERICVSGEMLPDAVLCPAFSFVAQLEGQQELSYFEFAFLASLKVLLEQQVDVLLLEVGVGGRLDAANILDPDLSVVTTVAKDHQTLLGDSVEEIAREKAHIFRQGKPAVCGMAYPPRSLVAHVESIEARGLYNEKEFRLEHQGDRLSFQCCLPGGERRTLTDLPRPGLPLTSLGCALQAFLWLWPQTEVSVIRKGIVGTRLAGRCQRMQARNGRGELITIVLDVAHNHQAASYLADHIISCYSGHGRRLAVVGMLKDKDAEAVFAPLLCCVNHWHLAPVNNPDRSCSAAGLAQILQRQQQSTSCHNSVKEALHIAMEEAESGDTLLVTGSFLTVGEALTTLGQGAQVPKALV